MSEREFDPSRYLTKVGPADYLPVMWRLVWLRERHPDAQIETLMLHHDVQAKHAIFRATVRIPDQGSAMGHGSETANDFRDYLEKAETKAIGRALSALGFGTQFSAHEFGDEAAAGRVVDSPVQRPQPVTESQPVNFDEPTEPQRKMLFALSNKYGLSPDEMKTMMHARFGVESSKDLTRRQMSTLIDDLKKTYEPPLVDAPLAAGEAGADRFTN